MKKISYARIGVNKFLGLIESLLARVHDVDALRVGPGSNPSNLSHEFCLQ